MPTNIREKRAMEKMADLLLNYRFSCLRDGYWICMTMDNLPSATFGSKDHGNPQIAWGDILTSANLCIGPLYPHNIGKLRSYVLRYYLEGSDLAISVSGCTKFLGLSNLPPAAH